MADLTPAQKRQEATNKFLRKYGQYWLVYAALTFTAVLSFTSGMILPFTPDEFGMFTITFGGVLAGLYYSLGFTTNGELAANYWFDKLTDHDKDNTPQKIIAGLMLTISIGVSLTTALAAAAQIAFLLGALGEFRQFPVWAQEWVVWSIPTMWTLNAVAGMAFKALSDEASAERDANAIIRSAKQEISKARMDAKANYWKQNAPDIARQLGEMEARNEIEAYAVRLNQPKPQNTNKPAQMPVPPMPTARAYGSVVEDEIADFPKGQEQK